MSDLIYRQAAIDAHYEYCNKHPDAGFPVWSLKILENLPSAQSETHEKRTETHACDLISRQAVIEINRSYHGQMPNEVNHRIWKEINELPSAQSEKRTDKCTETHSCDCISRQAAIDALKEAFNPSITNFVKAKIAIDKLPSAQPEIIHCRDCKHWREGAVYMYCDKLFGMGVLDAYDYMTDEDDYCSRAERRTDEKENI